MIAALLLKLGIPAGLHKFVLIAVAVVALIAGFLIWDHFDDRAAVKADRKAAEAEVAKTALEAERTANRADVTRQAENQANDAATRKAINDAAAKDPEGAKAPAGPAARAAADSLRRRQSSHQPPARRARATCSSPDRSRGRGSL